MITPVNLAEELEEISSVSYVRRVMARVLMHSGLALAEAREVWVASAGGRGDERAPDLWENYVPVIRSA